MKKGIGIKIVDKPNQITSYWKKEWKVVLTIIISGLIFDGSMSVGPILQGKIIDFIIADDSHRQIVMWIIIYVAIIAIIQFARYLKRYYVRIFANRTNGSMRLTVYNNIINKDVSLLNSEKIGDLMTKAISDVGACVEGMRKFTTEIFDTGILMFSYFITMLFQDIKITILACIFIPLAMFLAEKLKKIIYRYSDSYRKQISTVSNMALENIDNQLLFRVNSVEKIREDMFLNEIEDLQTKSVKANMLENSMQPIYNAISMIGVLAIIYLGGNKVISGDWTIGQFSAYLTIFAAFAVKAAKAAKLFNSIHKAQISWQRIKPFLTGYKENYYIEDKSLEKTELNVNNLNFRKIKDANFSIKTGEIVGVTGPVASGKSTLGIVFQGLYAYEGSILINGKELRDIPPEERESQISYLGHDRQLLSDSIYNNITLGKAGNIDNIIHDIAFDTDLKTMKDGLQTLIGSNGVRLSVGQQARIALGRTLYNKAGLIILDDPFAAVDVATEEKILTALKNNYTDTAIILISHRTEIFDKLSNILFVEDGNVTQCSHEQLLAINPVYKTLYQTQTGGYDHE